MIPMITSHSTHRNTFYQSLGLFIARPYRGLFHHLAYLLSCVAQLPAGAVDVEILHDATRREARAALGKPA